MTETINDPMHTFIASIVDATVPLVLAKVAPHLTANADDVIAVERAAELGLTRRVLEDAIRRQEIPGLKLGRKLAAKRRDVIAWRDARAYRRRERPARPLDETTTLEEDVAAEFARMTAS
jgi:hypothetical protein